eukprot:scpid104491/ scgid24451/ 
MQCLCRVHERGVQGMQSRCPVTPDVRASLKSKTTNRVKLVIIVSSWWSSYHCNTSKTDVNNLKASDSTEALRLVSCWSVSESKRDRTIADEQASILLKNT